MLGEDKSFGYNQQAKSLFSINEEKIVEKMIVDYLDSLSNLDYYSAVSKLSALYSFVRPYAFAYRDITTEIENGFTSLYTYLSKLEEYKRDYKIEEYNRTVLLIMKKLDDNFQKINDILARSGFRKTPYITISLVPNYFAVVDEIYKKKYGIIVGEELGVKEEELINEGYYVAREEIIKELNEVNKEEVLSENVGNEFNEVINERIEKLKKIVDEKVEKINKNKETLDKMKNPEENVQNTPENNEDNKTDCKGEYLDDLDNAVNELDAFVKNNKKIQEANKKKVKKEEDIEEIVLEETMFDEINSKYDLDMGE
jgi:hypothetical protein